MIVAFSLLAYIALQNWRSTIVQALCVLLGGIVIVFGGDVLIGVAQRDSTVQVLLRAQWLGIVLVPAGYIHLTDALVRASGRDSSRPRWMLLGAYLASAIWFGLVAGTDWLLLGGSGAPLARLAPGPLFWGFSLYFALATLGGLAAVVHVRRAALTPTLRRRLGYLAITFLGPALAVYPYLSLPPAMVPLNPALLLLLAALGNAVALALTTVMVYSVAFQGMPVPDRLIKQDFVRWSLYGPFIGVSIILFVRVVPLIAEALALPRDTLLTFGIMIMTVVMPMLVSRVRPYIDTLVYTQDHAEIDYLRGLPRTTFTQTDLRSLLENTLVVICGALHASSGFVAAPDERGGYTIKSSVGSRRAVRQFLKQRLLTDVVEQLAAAPTYEPGAVPPAESFRPIDEFVLFPLRAPDGAVLGALGIALPEAALGAEARQLIGALAHRMELALDTVSMQRQLFGTLRTMAPEMQSLRELNTRLEQATPASLERLDPDIALLPEFSQWVKDALTHYWGGPKLSDSPLLELRSVRRAITAHDGNPTRALQAVLRRAIENLRPDAQLDPSAQEWLLYNILELRFLQGRRIRDTADRLAMSESDLYRKQRIAVEEVARQLALMEEPPQR